MKQYFLEEVNRLMKKASQLGENRDGYEEISGILEDAYEAIHHVEIDPDPTLEIPIVDVVQLATGLSYIKDYMSEPTHQLSLSECFAWLSGSTGYTEDELRQAWNEAYGEVQIRIISAYMSNQMKARLTEELNSLGVKYALLYNFITCRKEDRVRIHNIVASYGILKARKKRRA